MITEQQAAEDAKVALPADMRQLSEKLRRYSGWQFFDSGLREDLLCSAALLDRLIATDNALNHAIYLINALRDPMQGDIVQRESDFEDAVKPLRSGA